MYNYIILRKSNTYSEYIWMLINVYIKLEIQNLLLKLIYVSFNVGWISPLHWGIITIRQIILVLLVQLASCKAKVLQKARETYVFGRRETLQGWATGTNMYKLTYYILNKSRFALTMLLIFSFNCFDFEHKGQHSYSNNMCGA